MKIGGLTVPLQTAQGLLPPDRGRAGWSAAPGVVLEAPPLGPLAHDLVEMLGTNLVAG